MNNLKENIEKYYLYFTVFITGAVVLILEILGTRIIAPYYGTTLYVWSSLIAVTLVALAIGYFLGGCIADKISRFNILYKIILLTAFSILLIPFIKNFVLINTDFLGPMYGALTSAVMLFAIPLMLLGTVVPYVIKLKTKELEKVGITTGSLYAIATIGSCVGAIITGFYLIPNIGINSIIYLSSSLLLLLSFLWFITHRKMILTAGIIVAVIFVIFAPSLITKPTLKEGLEIVYEKESAYSSLKVIDEHGLLRYLILNGATQTLYHLNSKKFRLEYVDLFEKAVGYHPAPKTVLNIGLGGGAMDNRLKKYDLNVDNVEIDPEVVKIAKTYFDFDGNVIVDDGRHYIRNTDKKYDIILLDVWGGYSIYPYLFSKEAFSEIKNALNKDGVLALNLLGYETDDSSEDILILSVYKTLKEVFPHVYVKSARYGFSTFVFYVSDSALELDDEFTSISVNPDESIPVLTDDYNPIEVFSVKTSEEFRNYVMRIYGNWVLC